MPYAKTIAENLFSPLLKTCAPCLDALVRDDRLRASVHDEMQKAIEHFAKNKDREAVHACNSVIVTLLRESLASVPRDLLFPALGPETPHDMKPTFDSMSLGAMIRLAATIGLLPWETGTISADERERYLTRPLPSLDRKRRKSVDGVENTLTCMFLIVHDLHQNRFQQDQDEIVQIS